MNKQRRKDLERALELIEQARQIVEQAATEERDYYENMPESLQGSDKGLAAEDAASVLEELTTDNFETLYEAIQGVIEA